MNKLIFSKILSLILAISISLLTACGGGGGDSSSKDMFSLWTSTADGFKLDLTGFGFGELVPYNIYYQDGSVCECDLVVIGTQTSGSYSLNTCFYRFGSGPADPGCNALNHGGSYTNSNNQLTLTNSSGSEVYAKVENPLTDLKSSKSTYY